MTENLSFVIEQYALYVQKGMQSFQVVIGDKNPLKALSEKLIKRKGTLENGISYSLHGIGCLFEIQGVKVDVDFAPNNRYDGFDLWRLNLFVQQNQRFRKIYSDKSQLEKDFFQAIESLEILPIPNSRLYYLVSPPNTN